MVVAGGGVILRFWILLETSWTFGYPSNIILNVCQKNIKFSFILYSQNNFYILNFLKTFHHLIQLTVIFDIVIFIN
jgi:hypothetical protein